MMAVEAMACNKPVIVFDGTALPEVIFVNEKYSGGYLFYKKTFHCWLKRLKG
jgi:glycosyltransferase involved in cell wall biosynthesis